MQNFKTILIIGLFTLLNGCASTRYTLDLMPNPEVFQDPSEALIKDLDEKTTFPYHGILYATNRTPMEKDYLTRDYYPNKRSTIIKLGMGEIQTKNDFKTAEELQKNLYLPKRPNIPIYVSSIKEFGALESSLDEFSHKDENYKKNDFKAQKKYAKLINAKLAISKKKVVNIYLNGYKVNFDKALLTSAGMWHFLGYDGVFIAFAWPSTPKLTSYFADLETAASTAYQLRLLLKFLREETDVEKINIIAYSAGSRIAIEALKTLTHKYSGNFTPKKIQKKLKLGHVVIISSDYDRANFGYLLKDGLLNILDDLTIYGSSTDQALSLSQLLLGGRRLGLFSEKNLSEIDKLSQFQKLVDLLHSDKLFLVDISGGKKTTKGNGHGYFRSSPWVSSDLICLLYYGLKPADRGLVLSENKIFWRFPKEYVNDLRKSLIDKKLLIPAPQKPKKKSTLKTNFIF